MFYEVTIQIRVTDYEQGRKWYETLLKKKADFIPHGGFSEWELIPGCWLQVSEGEPAQGTGSLRLGVMNIEAERERVYKELNVAPFEIFSREEVPVKWGTFTDPWGNRIGFFEYINEKEKYETIKRVLG
ncbi:MAG: VOC family protein [Tuberibacillus sp.]